MNRCGLGHILITNVSITKNVVSVLLNNNNNNNNNNIISKAGFIYGLVWARLEGPHHLKKSCIDTGGGGGGRTYVMKGPQIHLAQGPLKAQIRP